jgi:hypothetical protein
VAIGALPLAGAHLLAGAVSTSPAEALHPLADVTAPVVLATGGAQDPARAPATARAAGLLAVLLAGATAVAGGTGGRRLVPVPVGTGRPGRRLVPVGRGPPLLPR